MAKQQAQQYTNRSRLALGQPAIRANMKGKMLLSGPSGAGKTFTALLIASVLAGPNRTTRSIVLIDTEKSGTTYAQEFNLADGSPGYTIVSWQEPYNATDLAMTLRDCSEDPDVLVVIVDSHTHFWRGAGGVLDTASGRYTGWKEARPMQADMVDAILTCDAHVLLCAREVQEHVQEKDGDRWIVRKLGMKVQQDSDLEYEVNVGLSIDMNHVLHVTKSRTSAVPVGTDFIAGHAERFAGMYRDWLKGGEPAASTEQLGELIGALNRISDAATRQQAKHDFVDTFGRPEALLVSRLPAAQLWVADRLMGLDVSERAPDETPARSTHQEGEDIAKATQRSAGTDLPNATWCARKDCGHADLVHDDNGCNGVHVEGPPNTPEAFDRPCDCMTFVAPPAPPDAPPTGSTPQDTPTESAGAQEGTQGPDPEGPDVAAITARVETLTFPQVRDELEMYGKSKNGTFKHAKQRLVDAIVEAETPV